MEFPSNDNSDSSDGSDTSGRNDLPSGENDYTNAKSEVRNATKGDDRGVFLWRLIVKITMIVIGITLTVATYTSLKQSEMNEFLSAVSMEILLVDCPLFGISYVSF
jgi:hypothetical protein